MSKHFFVVVVFCHKLHLNSDRFKFVALVESFKYFFVFFSKRLVFMSLFVVVTANDDVSLLISHFSGAKFITAFDRELYSIASYLAPLISRV